MNALERTLMPFETRYRRGISNRNLENVEQKRRYKKLNENLLCSGERKPIYMSHYNKSIHSVITQLALYPTNPIRVILTPLTNLLCHMRPISVRILNDISVPIAKGSARHFK